MESDEESKKIPGGMRWQVLIKEEVMEEIGRWCRLPGITTEYRGTSSIRNRLPVGPYRRAMPRALWWSQGVERSLMSEVPMWALAKNTPRQRKDPGPGSTRLCKVKRP